MEGLRRCESDALRCGTVGCVAMRYYAGDVEVETSRVCHHQKRNGKSRGKYKKTDGNSLKFDRKSAGNGSQIGQNRSRGPSETQISVPLPFRAPKSGLRRSGRAPKGLRRRPGDPPGTEFGSCGRGFGDVFRDPEQNRRFSEKHGFTMAGA